MRNKEMTVGEISEILDAPISTISRNLAVLSKAGFVTGKNRGTYLHYSIRKADVHPRNVALLALVKNASAPKKKSKVKALISAAMFDPRLAKYLEVLSWEE
jgi:DNA-binding transcriptional ArsR family regulator